MLPSGYEGSDIANKSFPANAILRNLARFSN